MPGSAGTNLGLTYGWGSGEVGWGSAYNSDMRTLSQLVMGAVLNTTLSAPPGAPVEGDRYIIAAGASGAWSGRSNQIAVWDRGAWVYWVPKVGWRVHNIATDRMLRFDGSAWGHEARNWHPGMPTGFTQYFFSPMSTLSTVAAAVTAGRLYYQPIKLPGAVVDRIGIDVTTGAAGNCRLGIFANAAPGVPGALIIDAGTVDTTSIATVEASFSAVTLPDAWCWLAAIFEVAPQVRNGGVGSAWLVGSNAFSAGWRALYTTHSYGVLPPTAPALTGGVATAPLIGIRKS